RTRSGMTLDEFLRKVSVCPCTLSPFARALLNVRLFVGRLLGWDREPTVTGWDSFAKRLTAVDQSNSLVPPGTPEPKATSTQSAFSSKWLAEVSAVTPFTRMLPLLPECRPYSQTMSRM